MLDLRFRGPGRRSLGAKSQKSQKSLEKVSRPGVPKVRKKSRKRSEKSPKTHIQIFFDFSDLFRDFFWTFGARPRETLFETFLRLFGFWPRDSFSQVHGTSMLDFCQMRVLKPKMANATDKCRYFSPKLTDNTDAYR